MSKRKKQQIETWTAGYVASSKRFVACMFLGRGQYDKREADSLEGARLLKAQMLKEYEGKNYGRGVCIYAISPITEINIFVE